MTALAAAEASPADAPRRVLLSKPEAATALGLGLSKVNELIYAGELGRVQIGRRRLVPAASIDEFVEGLRRSTC